MRSTELEARTKGFALRIIKMYGRLPKRVEAEVLGKQVLRSGTGVAANYCEAARARSKAEFIAKLGVVEQELAETKLWLELLVEGDIVPNAKMTELQNETEELLKIIVASMKTLKGR
ncbi:MAG: four helix bundle protein [Planctomycetales bacterium]|nr:four helix bundle protein [Planctomycetales bacterium]MBN8627373.1 four helix bundle protein [Planctomycetota bacterium]